VLHIPDIKAEIEARQQTYGYKLLASRRRVASKADLLLLGEVSDQFLCSRLRLPPRCRWSSIWPWKKGLIGLSVVPEASEQDFLVDAAGHLAFSARYHGTKAENHIYSRAADQQTATVSGKSNRVPHVLVVERRNVAQPRSCNVRSYDLSGRNSITSLRASVQGERREALREWSPRSLTAIVEQSS